MISERKEFSIDKKTEKLFISKMAVFINKIDSSINNFRFNVCIANFYEMYNFFRKYLDTNISEKILKDNLSKIMKLMIPFTPHLAYECLELLDIELSIRSFKKIVLDKKSNDIIEINAAANRAMSTSNNVNPFFIT